MNTLGRRLLTQRKELQLTQKALASKVGVSHVTISQWEKGETTPKGENLLSLGKSLGLSPDWLLTGEGNQKKTSHLESEKPNESIQNRINDDPHLWVIGGINVWDSNTELGEDEVELPFFTEVELSAGHGSNQVKENVGPKLRFAKSTLKRKGIDPTHAACVKVSGNSMEPVLPCGSTIGIDTSQKEIIDGKMYAIDHDGMLRVKTLYRLPGGGMRLKSFNSHEYPDEMYKPHEAKDIRIIGKVFWYSVLL